MTPQHHVAVIPMLVKPDRIQEFISVFDQNAACSRQEPGVLRFEAMQSKEEPMQFFVVEIYRTPQDQLDHRETAHFKTFKQQVADLLAEPYTPQSYTMVSMA